MNINGTWEGEYIYGDDYLDGIKDKAIKFTVQLTTNGSEIAGSFTDEESRHIFPEGGVLAGMTENNYISLTKQYPHGWEFNEAGEMVLHPDSASHYIVYEGFFTGDKFEGSWEIPMYDPTVEYESIYHYEHIGGSGTWWMKKKE